MNRPIAILSVLSFVGITLLAILMFTGVMSFINNFKYLVVLVSLFLTLFSMGWFVHQQELPKPLFLLISFLLALPFMISILGLVSADYFLNLWKVFIGLSIFQIGTGVYALLGGFIKKGLMKTQKYMSVFNYIIFLFLTSIMVFDLKVLMDVSLYIILGGLASLLSVMLVVIRKSTASL